MTREFGRPTIHRPPRSFAVGAPISHEFDSAGFEAAWEAFVERKDGATTVELVVRSGVPLGSDEWGTRRRRT